MSNLIKFKRGNKVNLTKLSYGEPAYISDEKELYIGTESGNIKLTNRSEIQNLKNNISETSQQLEFFENETKIKKADKDYVDVMISSIKNGSPKGVYNSLDLLKQSIPSGDNNIYITSDNGHWNYWNGSSWISGGIYQGIKIDNHSITEEKIEGLKFLNMCVESTYIKGSYIDITTENISKNNDSIYSLIEVTENTEYIMYREVPESLIGRDLVLYFDENVDKISSFNMTDNIMSYYNEFKVASFITPPGTKYIGINVKINSFNASNLTFVALNNSIIDKDRINDIKGIFNRDIWDYKTENKLYELLNSVKGSKNNLYKYYRHYRDGMLVDTTGTVRKSTGWGCVIIPIEQEVTYSIYLPFGEYSTLIGCFAFLDKKEKCLEYSKGNTLISGNVDGQYYISYTAPKDACYLAFSVYKEDLFDNRHTAIVVEGANIDSSDINNYLSEINGVKVFNGNDFNNTLQHKLPKIEYILNNLYSYEKHYYMNKLANTSGQVSTSEGWGCAIIPAKPNTTYSIYFKDQKYTSIRGEVVYLDNSKLSIGSTVYADIELKQCYNGNYITITTPSNTSFVAFTVNNSSLTYDDRYSLLFIEGDTIKETEQQVVGINGYKLYDNTSLPLKGKKWVVVGDSLTETNRRATKNYHDYVTEDTGVYVHNMGISGTGYKKMEENNKAFYQRVNNIPVDADIVTFFGSGNDLSLDLGKPSDTTTDTICGCMNKTFETLFSRIPGVKVGVVLPCPWGAYPPTIQHNKMMLYVEALREVAKRHSIPVLDLYYESNLRPWDITFRNLYYKHDEGNSVHPDEDGHKILSNKFKMFIQSL